MRSSCLAYDANRLAVFIEYWLVDKFNKEITMIDRSEKRDKKHEAEYQQWQELSKAHWSHWRAWGSWFSWGSPVGLGIFVTLVALSFAIIKFAINL